MNLRRAAVVIVVLALVTAALQATPAGAAGPQLVANPSFETSATGNAPDNWSTGQWGNNSATFSWITGGHSGSRAARVQITSRSSGDAKWAMDYVPVTAGTAYVFSDWYRASASTSIVAEWRTPGGALSYQWLRDVPAASSWANVSGTFTAPIGVTSFRVFHLLARTGWLEIDDVTITGPDTDPPPPTVTATVTAPTAGTTVSGTNVALTATATSTGTGAPPIQGVTFAIDGTPVGPEDTTAPYTATWNTTTATNGTHTITAIARTSQGNTTSPGVTVTVNNSPITITATVTAPTAGTTVSGTNVALTATATSTGTGAPPIQGVTFAIDGTPVGPEDTTAPYTATWNTTTATNGTHTITAIARTSQGNTTSPGVTVTVNNSPVTITATVTAPTAGTTVSGTNVALTATATSTGTGAPPIQGVTFAIDGTPVGPEDTTAPYTATWNTTTATNGTHTITAIARTSQGNTTSPGVTVTVNNAPVPPPSATELIPNPSVEQTAGSVPVSWQSNSWGSISATFSHMATGGHTGSRFVRTQVTARSSGDAKWYFTPQPVTGGTTYRYTDWYRANTTSQIVVAYSMSSGSTQYLWLGDLPAASSWTRFSALTTAPAGAVAATVYHLIASVGYVETDDHSLTEGSGPGFQRPLVSLTFDDGWASHATTALPMLQQYGMPATFYVTSGFLGTPAYMTNAQLLQIHSAGHEIASHTISHPHLPQLSSTQLTNELVTSRQTLEALIGQPVPNFASPYGEYNSTVLARINDNYSSHRTVNDGLNSRSDLDPAQLRVKNVFNTTTRAEVEGWLAAAKSQGAWLILVLHDINPNPGQYDTSPTMLQQYLQAVQASGVTPVTVDAALSELLPQVTG